MRTGFAVVHSAVIEEEPYPRINVTIRNDTQMDQIITALQVVISDYTPYASLPGMHVLRPTAVWNV